MARCICSGRGSLCINTGGEKVYPEEVEAVLKGLDDIADAVVVGAPDPRLGQRVVAIVAARERTAGIALDAVQDACRAHLAGYKVPRAVFVVDEVRRGDAGKVDYAWGTRRRRRVNAVASAWAALGGLADALDRARIETARSCDAVVVSDRRTRGRGRRRGNARGERSVGSADGRASGHTRRCRQCAQRVTERATRTRQRRTAG